jgi:hypothetical protein
MENPYRAPQRLGKSPMVLLVSVFQAEAQLDLFGLGLNSVQSVSNSFLVIQVATAGVGADGSSSRHFADFSLN